MQPWIINIIYPNIQSNKGPKQKAVWTVEGIRGDHQIQRRNERTDH